MGVCFIHETLNQTDHNNFSLSELPRITPMVIAWLTTQVFVDAFITGTLVSSIPHIIKVLVDNRQLP